MGTQEIIREGQHVSVRHSRFGKRSVIATVLEVMPTTVRVKYSDPTTRSHGCCVVKRSNVTPMNPSTSD